MLRTTQQANRSQRLREAEDRRLHPDRRQSGIDMRLRVGLWYQYHRATRAGEFDPLPRNDYYRQKITTALLPEMAKYTFCKPGSKTPASPEQALVAALDFLWSYPQLGCSAVGDCSAVYGINAIAEYLWRTFEVAMIDRRKSDRRTGTGNVSNAVA